MSGQIRFTGGVTSTEVACPLCGVINELPYDITNPSKRQIVTCGKKFGSPGDQGGCGEEFVYHVSVAVTGYTAPIGDWKPGPTTYKGEFPEVETEEEKREREALAKRLASAPVRSKETPKDESEDGVGEDDPASEVRANGGGMVQQVKSRVPLVGRRGREI